jgi:hypothetical protein
MEQILPEKMNLEPASWKEKRKRIYFGKAFCFFGLWSKLAESLIIQGLNKSAWKKTKASVPKLRQW